MALLGGQWQGCTQNGTAQNGEQPLDSIAEQLATDTAQVQQAAAPTAEVAPKREISVIGVGDIMLGTSHPSTQFLPPNDDPTPLLADVKTVLQSADCTFGNFEGVLIEGGVAKSCSDPSVCYVFRMSPHYAGILKDAGFDLLSIANNHAGDFGSQGRESTMQHLGAAGLVHAGTVSNPSAIWENEGIKYGFCAFSPENGSAPILDYTGAQEIVRKLEAECDIVIVSFHAGAEGSAYQHTPCRDEIAYGYNRGNVCKFSEMVIDAGADIVFGHGPHVTRAVNLYKGRFIAYSMGNFCTYSRMNISGMGGIAPIFKVFVDEEGEFLRAETIPTHQIEGRGTFVDPQKRVIKVIQDLTAADFPNSGLTISGEGLITRSE